MMWPFRQHSSFELPPWNFQPIAEERSALCLSGGTWLATDGGHLRQTEVVMIGQLETHDVEIFLEQSEEGLNRIRLRYSDTNVSRNSTQIVIDSGYLVLCCQEAFIAARITAKASLKLLQYVNKQYPKEAVVAVFDVAGCCIGLVIAPPFGDGAYGLYFESSKGATCLRIELGQSL